MARPSAAGLAGICAVLFGCGCADLPTIPTGVCGNGVAEPENGEDCDGKAPAGATCGVPSSSQACRYVCQIEKGDDCPSGYACGLDGLCRAPASTFRSAVAAIFHSEEAPLDIVVADADRDHRADIFEQSPRSVVLHYDVTKSTASLTVARDPFVPAIGPVADLSDDSLADAVIPAGLGYFVSLGGETHIERATAYGAIALPSGASDVQALSAEVLPDVPGSEIIALAKLSLAGQPPLPVIVNVGTDGALAFIGTLPDVPSKLAGPVRPGRLNEDGSVIDCDELVLAYRGAAALDLLVPCTRSSGKTVLAEDVGTSPVRLPKGATIAGPVEIEDLDRDGHLDLVVITSRSGQYEIDVAYGRGDGSFDSVPGADPNAPADDAAGTSVIVGSVSPLAVFDLDGDQRPDWVDPSGIYISRASEGGQLRGPNEGAPWTTALVDRFDGDTLPDVAVGSKNAPGLTLFLNAKDGTFTAFPIETRGNTTMLSAGDFDGDRVRDLAAVTATAARAATSTTAKTEPFDTLNVVFGAAYGVRNAPKSIGQFHHIEFVANARVGGGALSVVDGADDLGALAQDEEGTLAFAVVLGQGNRDLRAPYGLTRTELSEKGVAGYSPARLAVGDADGDGHPDVMSLAVQVHALVDGVPSQQAEQRFWATPMKGEASISLGQSAFSAPLDVGFDWEHVLFGAIDLDGKPGDELVVLGPRSGASGYQSAIAHATRSGMSGPTYALAKPVALDGVFSRSETALPVPDKVNGRLRTADIDGDGAKDVLVLRQRGERGELVVYFNDLSGNLGSPTVLTNGEKLDVRDFAIVPVPGSPKSKPVILARAGVYTVTVRDRELTAGDTPALIVAPSTPTLISAGDMNGDGVPDVALAGPAGMEVHLGVSANPKDAL